MDYSKCKDKYQYLYDENSKPLNIVSNFGLKKFEKAFVSRNGEYHNFCIEALEDISPILSNHLIEKAIPLMKVHEYDKASLILNVHQYWIKYNDIIVDYVVNKWLKINKFDAFNSSIIDDSAKVNADDLQKIDTYVCTQRQHPLLGKIKIISIGQNTKTGESVVPAEWLNKEFESGHDLHQQMDKLPSRKGKAPVSFCCIYSMSLKKEDRWIKSIEKIDKNTILFDVIFKDDMIRTKIIKDKEIKEIKNDGEIIKINNNVYIRISKGIFQIPVYCEFKGKSVGYYSSTLQKCMRRGPETYTLMESVCNELNKSKPYNLPDHNFVLVSGTRQVLWRSYISIVEDAKGYLSNQANFIDMFTLVLLTIISNFDAKLQLTDEMMQILIKTMKVIQSCEDSWNWRKCKEKKDILLQMVNNDHPNSQVLNSINLSINFMPMMENDRIMLQKVYEYTLEHDLSSIENIKSIKSDDDVDEIKNTALAGMDMHCKPTMLIELQGMIQHTEFIRELIPSLEKLSHYIWNNFSSTNFRYYRGHVSIYSDDEINKFSKYYEIKKSLLLVKIRKMDLLISDSIIRLQDVMVNGRKRNWINWVYSKIGRIKPDLYKDNQTDENHIGRSAWLLLFGKKYKVKYKGKTYDVIMAGSTHELCKIKSFNANSSEYITGDLRTQIQEQFLSSFEGDVIQVPNPPDGYKWKLLKKKVTIKIDKNNFYVDDSCVTSLDLMDQLEKIDNIIEEKEIPEDLSQLIKITLYVKGVENIFGEDVLYWLEDIAYFRRLFYDSRVFNWKDIGSQLHADVWRMVIGKFYIADSEGTSNYNNSNNGAAYSLIIGPCDRRGKKTNNSISYIYEGIIYRIVLLLEALYPSILMRKGHLKWMVYKSKPEYNHLMNILQSLSRSTETYDYHIKKVVIKTTLWEHQNKTINQIFRGMMNGKRGFGDASHVGAGKTLSAIGLIKKLYDFNSSISSDEQTYAGFLVLLPSLSLIPTWKDEIEKHSTGFNLIVQESNGTMNKSIGSRSIVISTLGRMRDHPISHPWVLVIIDECLSVQNKEALQTEEAWRQTCGSQYGIVMMSATFFRSRFDKMLYMLKMLKSGLPETREYLDTILAESMICHITKTDRIWTVNTSKVELSKTQRLKYDQIYKTNISNKASSEKLYIDLSNYINSHVDYVQIFIDKLKECENDNHRCVIFAKSKDEADRIALQNEEEIGRYPKKLKHTVLSYAEGTYGLNDLVIYDTILMRPPEPDKLPQIKGRLDRPNQKSKNLFLEYVLLKDTIEEAGLLRMEMCNNFFNNYIMPLSEFYDLAVTNSTNVMSKSNSLIPAKILS